MSISKLGAISLSISLWAMMWAPAPTQARGLYFNPRWTRVLTLMGEDGNGRLWFASDAPKRVANGFVSYDGQNWELYRLPHPPFSLANDPTDYSGYEDIGIDYDFLYFPPLNRFDFFTPSPFPYQAPGSTPLFSISLRDSSGAIFNGFYRIEKDWLVEAFPLAELPSINERTSPPEALKMLRKAPSFKLIPIFEPGLPLSLFRAEDLRHRHYRIHHGQWKSADQEFALEARQDDSEYGKDCKLLEHDRIGRRWFNCSTGLNFMLVMMDEQGRRHEFPGLKYSGQTSEQEAWGELIKYDYNTYEQIQRQLVRLFKAEDSWNQEIMTPEDSQVWAQTPEAVFYCNDQGHIYKLEIASRKKREVAVVDAKVYAIGLDHDGTLWAGTDATIESWSTTGEHSRWVYNPDQQFVPHVGNIFVDSRNHKWFSFEGEQRYKIFDGFREVYESVYLDSPLKYDGRKWHYVSLGQPTDSPQMPLWAVSALSLDHGAD